MSNTPPPTDVADVALPYEIVELEKLRTRDQQPVRVGCEAIDELRMARILKSLPGGRPAVVRDTESEPDPESSMDAFGPLAELLIEAGTFLVAGDREIRPAFWFSSDPGNGALRGAALGIADRVKLAHTLMRIGGYLGGAADDSEFPGDGRGRRGGLGAVAPGEGGGEVPARADEPAAPHAAPGAGV